MAACWQEWAVSEVTGPTLLRAASWDFPCLVSALSHWAPALAVCELGPKALVLKIRLRLSLASELLIVSHSPLVSLT